MTSRWTLLFLSTLLGFPFPQGLHPLMAHTNTPQSYFAYAPSVAPGDTVLIYGKNAALAQTIEAVLTNSNGVETRHFQKATGAQEIFLFEWKNETTQTEPYFLVTVGMTDSRNITLTMMTTRNGQMAFLADQRVFWGNTHSEGRQESAGGMKVEEIRSFPSPVQGRAQMAYTVDGPAVKLALHIWTPSGRLAKTVDVPNPALPKGMISFDSDGLGTGVYLAELVAEDAGAKNRAAKRIPLPVIGGEQ